MPTFDVGARASAPSTACRPTSPATSCCAAIRRAPADGVPRSSTPPAAVVGVLSLRDLDRVVRVAEAARRLTPVRFRGVHDAPEPAPPTSPPAWSGVHRGPLRVGEWVRLVDAKGRKHNICLEAGKTFHTNRGGMSSTTT